jgi:hypothetical protein
MDKNVSIVLVDPRHYRKIARDNWGLTNEQMRGMHVHHRIRRCDGGTNDPSNLYVCSEWFHDNIWHAEEGGFTGCASEGGKKGGLKGGPVQGKRNVENQTGFLKPGAKTFETCSAGGKKGGAKNVTSGRFDPESPNCIKSSESCRKGGLKTGGMNRDSGHMGRIQAMRWEDPDHPELGVLPAGPLVIAQRSRGYPSGKENRRLVKG